MSSCERKQSKKLRDVATRGQQRLVCCMTATSTKLWLATDSSDRIFQLLFYLFLFFFHFKVFIEIVTILLLFYVFCFCLEVCGILAPQTGLKAASPALEGEVLSTGPPGKSIPAIILMSRPLYLCLPYIFENMPTLLWISLWNLKDYPIHVHCSTYFTSSF